MWIDSALIHIPNTPFVATWINTMCYKFNYFFLGNCYIKCSVICKHCSKTVVFHSKQHTDAARLVMT